MGKGNKKAQRIGTSLDKTCSICYLLESTNKKTKFHLYKNGYYNNKKYVCEHCLNWIKEMKKRAVDQCVHHDKDSFKDVNFWWKPKDENESAIEVCSKK